MADEVGGEFGDIGGDAGGISKGRGMCRLPGETGGGGFGVLLGEGGVR